MELIFKIIYIVLILTSLIFLYVIAKMFTEVAKIKVYMDRDIEMYKLKFSEQEILSHLDFIIEECLDYYIAMNITPKQLYYINNSTETEIVNALSSMVPERLSPTLYSQLSLIYNTDKIGTVIGEKIYTKVLAYVIEFNIQNDSIDKKNIKP